jgi:hypothetical protein
MHPHGATATAVRHARHARPARPARAQRPLLALAGLAGVLLLLLAAISPLVGLAAAGRFALAAGALLAMAPAAWLTIDLLGAAVDRADRAGSW